MQFPKFLRAIVLGSTKTIKVNSTYEVTRKTFDAANVKFTEIFAQALGFSYELVHPPDGELGKRLQNGSWTGVSGMIQRKEGDIAFCNMAYNPQREEIAVFSYPFFRARITFGTRKPEYSPEPGAFLGPFGPEVWWFIIAWFVAMPFVFSVLFQKKYSLRKYVWSVYSTFMGKGCDLQPRKIGDYLLILFWILGIMLLTYSYTAVLLSFLSFPPLKGIRTIPELAAAVAKGKYQCTTYKGSIFGPALAKSSDPNLKIIGHNLMENKGNNNVDAVLNNTKSIKKPAFVGGETHLKPLEMAYFVSEDEFFSVFLMIHMRKDFCCKSAIDRVVHYIWASGLYNKLSKDIGFKTTIRKMVRSPNVLKKNQERPLSVEDFSGLFFLLAAGNVSAILVFLCELLIVELLLKMVTALEDHAVSRMVDRDQLWYWEAD